MRKNLILLALLIALGGVAYFLYGSNNRNTLDSNEFTDFAVEDTASITKINIIDKVTGSVSLTRDLENGGWKVGDKHKAKSRSVEICLEAIKNVKIKGIIPKAQQRTIISNAAGAGTKIEIYTSDSEVPEKIWISAGNTANHHGDYFILEIPGKGISPEPFIVDMPMFAGFITARFHTVYNDWRFSGVFNHPKLDFKNITVEETAAPKSSFSIDWDGDEEFKVSNPITGKELKNLNLPNVKDYILGYKKIHLETFTLGLTKEQQDSVLATCLEKRIT